MAQRKKQQEDTETKKPKRKANGRNSPVIGDNGMMTSPGDNAKYIHITRQLSNLPKIELNNPEEVEKRIDLYFQIMEENDCKPAVMGLGMALGLDRRRLWEIRCDCIPDTYPKLKALPDATKDAIKKAHNFLEVMWENYMQNGKINPVSGIFLGKNNYGYKDKSEYVLTPNAQKEEYDAEGIRRRYLCGADEKNEQE